MLILIFESRGLKCRLELTFCQLYRVRQQCRL